LIEIRQESEATALLANPDLSPAMRAMIEGCGSIQKAIVDGLSDGPWTVEDVGWCVIIENVNDLASFEASGEIEDGIVWTTAEAVTYNSEHQFFSITIIYNNDFGKNFFVPYEILGNNERVELLKQAVEYERSALKTLSEAYEILKDSKKDGPK
jgi:hypothetical protein